MESVEKDSTEAASETADEWDDHVSIITILNAELNKRKGL